MARVSYFENAEDMEVAVLGSLGFSTQYIAARSGLSHSQVQYRLSKAHISRADFRNGNGLARRIVLDMRPEVESYVTPSLRKAMREEVVRLRIRRRA